MQWSLTNKYLQGIWRFWNLGFGIKGFAIPMPEKNAKPAGKVHSGHPEMRLLLKTLREKGVEKGASGYER